LYLIDKHVKTLQTPERVTLFTMYELGNSFTNNGKLELNMRYTDAAYWEVFSHKVLEGKTYTEQEVEQEQPIVVINATTRDNYFGKNAQAVGQTIVANNRSYKVAGVVEDVAITNIHATADVYLPYTLSPEESSNEQGLIGSFFCIVQPKNLEDIPAIKEEFAASVSSINVAEHHEYYHILEVYLDDYLASFTRRIMGSGNTNNKELFLSIVYIFMLLFMLLPAINLINLNITRIMERAAEIGVRKAFGASKAALVKQFLVENLVITFIGGLIGFALTLLVLLFINQSQLIPYSSLSFSPKVFVAGLLVTLIFGLLSGVYPALRMSRLQVAKALKISE
jgi:putative ABC transport system permease protein